MSQGLVSITDTNKSTIAKRKTAPKLKLMTHHKKAIFWNCNFGLLWQQGKYSSNGFAQMHLHQRGGGALQWIISLQCIAMALGDKVVSSVQKRVKAQRGLASNCPPCVRSFKEQRWHWGEIVKIQKSSISPLHLFSICKSAVVTNLSNLIQGNCPGWPLPPPTSHLSVCVNPCHLILPLKPFSAQRVVAAPRLIRTNPLESRQSPWRATSASQGSARPSKGPLSNYWGSSFYANSQEGFSKICCNYSSGLGRKGWAELGRPGSQDAISSHAAPHLHMLTIVFTLNIEHCKCLILCHPTSAHATSPSGSHCSCIAHVLTFPWVGFVSYIFTAQRLGLAVTVHSLLLCRWLWLLSNLGRNRLAGWQPLVTSSHLLWGWKSLLKFNFWNWTFNFENIYFIEDWLNF